MRDVSVVLAVLFLASTSFVATAQELAKKQ